MPFVILLYETGSSYSRTCTPVLQNSSVCQHVSFCQFSNLKLFNDIRNSSLQIYSAESHLRFLFQSAFYIQTHFDGSLQRMNLNSRIVQNVLCSNRSWESSNTHIWCKTSAKLTANRFSPFQPIMSFTTHTWTILKSSSILVKYIYVFLTPSLLNLAHFVRGITRGQPLQPDDIILTNILVLCKTWLYVVMFWGRRRRDTTKCHQLLPLHTDVPWVLQSKLLELRIKTLPVLPTGRFISQLSSMLWTA